MAERITVNSKKPVSIKENLISHKRKTDFRSNSSPVNRILYLQRTIGNQTVQRLIKSGTLQAKLRIGQPGDKYEQEADRVADAVMRMSEPGVQREVEPEEEEEETLQSKPLANQITPLVQVQRQEEPEEEEETLQAKPLAQEITPLVQRQGEPEEKEELQMQPMEEEEELMQGKFASGLANTLQTKPEASQNNTGMPDHLKSGLENLSSMNLSSIRVHHNSSKPAQLNALAYTQGQDIHLGPGQEKHLPHEGWHAVQQMQGLVKPTMQAMGVAINDEPGLEREAEVMGAKALQKMHVSQNNSNSKVPDTFCRPPVKNNRIMPAIQRRLVTFGTLPDVNALLGLLGPQAGLTLAMNVANNQVQINAVLPGAPPSATVRARLTVIINDAAQHAEVIVARGQPQVFVGAFPQPSNLTVTRTLQVDIDDVLAIEAGATGNGVAFAMHEIEENYAAHGVAPVAGTDRFPAAHQQAITTAENPIAAELVGPGRRVAFVQVPGTIVPTLTLPLLGQIPGTGIVSAVANTTAAFFDYENYYLGVTSRFVAATQDSQVVNAQRFPKTVISTRTIDSFASGSNVVPAAGAAAIAAAAADVAANPTATVRIQGFTDETGSAANNLTRSQQRANSAQAALGVAAGRVHAEGLGETNFVAPTGAGATPADRARNRRVVITVTRPQL